MKQLNGQAAAEAPASREVVYELLRDIERYPQWHGSVVREVRVIARDPERGVDRAATTLRAHVGPLDREFEMVLVVRAQAPSEVVLERVPHEPGDRERLRMTWTLTPLAAGGAQERTRVALALDAALDVPRLIPLPGGAGDQVARGFVEAALGALRG